VPYCGKALRASPWRLAQKGCQTRNISGMACLFKDPNFFGRVVVPQGDSPSDEKSTYTYYFNI